MKTNSMNQNRTRLPILAIALALIVIPGPSALAFTPSQQPPETTGTPGNVVLALSVEFPTGNQASYNSSANYVFSTAYDGYFDNRKCYQYDTTNEVFKPFSKKDPITGVCPGSTTEWSGNLLNWLTMTNLDQFRSVMTGGTRDNFSSKGVVGQYPGDTTGRTVLIRSFGSQQGGGNNITKNLAKSSAGMPLPDNLFARSAGYGSKFIVSSVNDLPGLTVAQQQGSCASLGTLTTTLQKGQCFNIRVEVCTAVGAGSSYVGLEDNCVAHAPGVAKPEGLIQGYANKMRFAALGYLNLSDTSRDGAVLRSAMKSVGAKAAIAGGGSVTNSAVEWDTLTGILNPNPDSADASATDTLIGKSNYTKSGLINYLNQFGYSGGSYETYDNVSELYYAALLYLRGRAPPAGYSNNLTSAITDQFPVITGTNLQRSGARDPIINSCQKNFILGIGDINTHCDGNLPGSTNTKCSDSIPTDSDGLNVQSLWNTIAGYEGMANTGAVGVWSGSGMNGGNTPYIAGLAHWAHTNDIRSDLNGSQNVSTYWVDVLESPSAPGLKTQYWMATKYGGFKTDLVTGNNPNTNVASWDSNGDGVPDNWYAGNSPATMKSGLTAAFSSIADASSGSSSSAAVTSSRQTSTSQILYAGYEPKGWLGTVRACLSTQTAALCKTDPVWEASQWFKTTLPTYVATPLTPTTRKIFTSWRDVATFSSMAFEWASLNAAQKSALDLADSNGAARVDYLRGNRLQENILFRKREDTLLGDIVNSGVTYLAGAGPAYAGATFDGYAAFRKANRGRPPVVYVGANDGMLHAFSGTDGKELFGYIPGSVFNNLPALTALNFQHKFFVDSTPMVGDVQKSATAWRTLLVGGLGAGGQGYYALDVTDQSAFATASEATLGTLPLWEFTSTLDADLGFTFNEPSLHPLTGAYLQIAKVAKQVSAPTDDPGAWRVIVGNGYGSTAGNAILFMLDANSGGVSTKLTTGVGPNNGLSAPTPVDTDGDGLIDTVYAGDALGNMHKFQFSKSNGTDFILANPKTVGGGAAWHYLGIVLATGQPITTAPSVARACTGIGANVAFGTGKLNEDTDYADTAARGFYAVTDNQPSSTLTVSGADIASISFTASILSTFTVRNWTAPNLVGKRGWKLNLTGGERVLSNSTRPADTGTVLFGTTKPNGDVCTPGNTGFIMAVSMCSGKTGDLLINGTLVGGVGTNSTGTVKVSPSYVTSDNQGGVVCNQDACKDGPNVLKNIHKDAPKGRYSWREILTK